MTIFLLAVYENRLELIEKILSSIMDKKALLAQKDLYGNNAVHLSVMANAPEIFSLLIKEGMQKDSKNNVILWIQI